MQPLPTTHRMMTWLSMCPPDELSTARQRAFYVANTSVVLFLQLLGFFGSVVFCLEYLSIDFNSATFAFMMAITEFGMIYFMIVAVQMCQQIENIFASLSTIYKNNENDVEFRYLARTNNTSEWMWSIYMKCVKIAIGGMAITCVLSVLYCYLYEGNFNADHFYRQAKLVYALPWNQTTHLGYFAEISVITVAIYGYFILNGTSLLLFISLCLHHRAFYKMFKHKIVKSEKCDVKLLCDLIRFRISTKDLFLDSANVYSSYILVQLICSVILMTISVFYIDLQLHEFDFIVATLLVTTSVGISNLFIYCYFGKLATESYEMMSDCVYNNMNWYEQPIELRKYFVLMIQNMQKPVYYRGFYVANLDLRTFIKLCNSVYSYYMVIKTLAAK